MSARLGHQHRVEFEGRTITVTMPRPDRGEEVFAVFELDPIPTAPLTAAQQRRLDAVVARAIEQIGASLGLPMAAHTERAIWLSARRCVT